MYLTGKFYDHNLISVRPLLCHTRYHGILCYSSVIKLIKNVYKILLLVFLLVQMWNLFLMILWLDALKKFVTFCCDITTYNNLMNILFKLIFFWGKNDKMFVADFLFLFLWFNENAIVILVYYSFVIKNLRGGL